MSEALRPRLDLDECIYPLEKEDVPTLAGDITAHDGRQMYGEYKGCIFKAVMPDMPKPESMAIVIGKLNGKFEIMDVPPNFEDIEKFVLHVVAATVLKINQISN